MIELIECLQKALAECGNAPLEVVDPHSRKTYVLLPIEEYEQLVFFAEENDPDNDIDSRQVFALIERNMREDDADDPILENF